jgi:hypothetical protein
MRRELIKYTTALRTRSKKTLTLAFIAGSSLLLAAPMAKAVPVIDIGSDASSSYTWSTDWTLGYRFSVANTPFTFNALGIFDVVSATPDQTGSTPHVNGLGLNSSHEVGVWDSSGILVASATVATSDPTTASASSYGQWVYHTLGSSVTLNPGRYTIGALFLANSDPVMMFQSSVINNLSPNVAYGEDMYSAGSTLAEPTANYLPGEAAYFGPTLLQVSDNNGGRVPDCGATSVLLGMGLLSLGVFRRSMVK